MPAGSRPKIAGNLGSGWCGNHVGQLLMTLAMFGTIPQALTRTSTSFGRGFGTGRVSSVMGSPSGLQSWAPGAEPILVSPSAELAAQSVDSNIKLSALEGSDSDTGAGESVAGKDDASRLQTPAQRLGLEAKTRAV